MPVQLYEHIINSLTEKSHSVKELFDPTSSFGVISTTSEEDSQKLKMHLAKSHQPSVMIHGVYEIASKDEDNTKELPDLAFLILPKKEQETDAFVKHLFHLSVQYNQPAFIYKPSGTPKMFIVGMTNDKWPGKGVKKEFGQFSFEKFPALFEKFKGKDYTFERFHKQHAKTEKSKETQDKNK